MNICLMIVAGGWGGAEAVVHELARRLRDKGNNVSLILNREMLKYYTDLENVQLFNIGPMYDSVALVKAIISPKADLRGSYSPPRVIIPLVHAYLVEFLGWLYFKRISQRVRQFLIDNHTDVFQVVRERAIPLLSELANLKIPTVVSSGGVQWMRGDRSLRPMADALRAPLLKWQASKLSRVLPKVAKVREGSNFMLTVWESCGVSLRDKFVAIPVGVNLTLLQSRSMGKMKTKGKFNLLFPGGARFVKGGDLLIPALAKVKQEIPGIHLYIALKVPQNHLLRKMTRDLGLEDNVTFMGFLPPPEYRQLLNSVDILVLPAREDNFPTVTVEAMALGKPVIAGNTGGIPEIIRDGRNGLLVEPETEQIAQAILRLYRSEAMRKEMSRNNLRDVARFDWSSVTEQYIGVYQEILGAGEVTTERARSP